LKSSFLDGSPPHSPHFSASIVHRVGVLFGPGPSGEARTMKRFAELAALMTPDRVERDAAAYVDFLASRESG
jgi:hypothetical protein